MSTAATSVLVRTKGGCPVGSKNKTTGARKSRRKMSDAARAKRAAAQKARWAKQKAASGKK